MASGYFQAKNDEKESLYCEWNTEADYETNTSRIILSVFIKCNSSLEIRNEEVVVNIEDRCEHIPAISFPDSNTQGTYTRLLYSGELQKVKHKSSDPEKISLSVSFRRENAEEITASGYIVLDPIPQTNPVLKSKHVTEISQNAAKLTMQASHPLGIKEYIFSIRDGEIKSNTIGETWFEDLLPDTYYVARFQAVANNGLATPVEVEIFKTDPIYIEKIEYNSVDPIEINENEAVQLKFQINDENSGAKVLQFIGGVPIDKADEKSEVDGGKLRFSSSNPRVASVSKNGVIQGISKGTCEIEITAADGGAAEASVLVNVIRPVEYVHITNQKIQLQKNSTSAGDENKTYRVAYSLYPDMANKEKLTFESSEPEIVDVDKDGVFVVKGQGSATITAISKDKPDGEDMGTCVVNVIGEDTGTENNNFVWQDLFMLPAGARWDYQIPDAINGNLLYIQKALDSNSTVELEDASFPNGFETDIRDFCIKLNALERNIDKINDEIPWVSPYYGEHREYEEYAPMRDDINRWIQFCADIKSVLDGEKGKLMMLSIDGEPLVICDDNESIQYLCLREEYFTNGNNL